MVNGSCILDVRRLNLGIGAFSIRDVSFQLDAGAYGILLGPTGCGKTLLAEILCGLVRPDSGEVIIGDHDATFLDPARRNIGYVPQDYALLPFLNVARNIAFGLEARRFPEKKIRERVDTMLELLGLVELRDRSPVRLSGGERQRVALGRALAIEPDLLVLDEPLSALDEATCQYLIKKMVDWHRELKITTIHICHRLEEAVSLASHLAVMRNGRIEQFDRPEVLLARPASAFIAEFLRLPNLISGEVRDVPEGRRFCSGGEILAEADCSIGSACGLYPWMKTTVSKVPPEPAQAVRCFSMKVVRNHLVWSRPGIELDGPFAMWIPGVFPQDVWKADDAAYVSIPESGWHILPK
jgi:ABC-type Fe3+/spermidine/putrescine transport system ATPase subunit